MTDDAETFESHRPALLSLSYRMLSDMARAEDMVQEAWVRWQNRQDEVLFEDQGFLFWLLRSTFLRNVAEDTTEMDRVVMTSDLEWTIARPPSLTNGRLTGHNSVEDDHMPRGGLSLSRADVAHFFLEELEHRAHVRRMVGMASARKIAEPSTRVAREEGRPCFPAAIGDRSGGRAFDRAEVPPSVRYNSSLSTAQPSGGDRCRPTRAC